MSGSQIVQPSLALLTDLYQVTMAYGYWKSGIADRRAVFNLFFRRAPFGSSYAVFCGLQNIISFLQNYRFEPDDLDYLAKLQAADGSLLFDKDFLAQLACLEFSCDVETVPEGTAVFANEPLIRITGPLLQVQLLETALLNLVNFPTLIATKAARITKAADGDPVLEFGLRRAQGVDGALTASYAAFLGGCSGTSNLLAGKLFAIPPRGTHAHSWVMAFESESLAFASYAKALPNNCVFLVDTYNSIQGVKNAIKSAHELRKINHEMIGVRLDSGDLATLSRQARALLDEAGFPKAKIVASNDLDESAIADLKKMGAKIDIWGVGTKLVTGYDQPALGGVFKMAALENAAGEWVYKLKLSEESIKVSNPGLQNVRRFKKGGTFVADVIFDERLGLDSKTTAFFEDGTERTLPDYDHYEDLLQPVFVNGVCVAKENNLLKAREYAAHQIESLPKGVTATKAAAIYPVGLETKVFQCKQSLIGQLRRNAALTPS